MKKKPIFLITILLISTFSLGFLSVAIASKEPLPDYEPIEVGPELRSKDLPIKGGVPESRLKTSASEVGDIKTWMTLDDNMGYYVFTPYMLRAASDNCEVWVQLDLSFPEGDPRETPIVTDEQCEYLLGEFDNNIYEADVNYFGEPNYHDGSYSLLEAWGYVPPGYYSDPEGSNVILVSNIIDESYYDPEYPGYIAGFYSPSFEGFFDRNIISIDAYDWEDRVGPDGDRPYLYDSTIGHEYQHLIHDDYLPSDETYMNEACSLFAEPLCGYGIDPGQIEWFLATPDNSLTLWGDQGGINILADYGAACLWALYLTSHYGFNFMADYLHGGLVGIEGINALLPPGVDFYDVYDDWRIANLLRTDEVGDGKYNYDIFDFDISELSPIEMFTVEGKDIPWTSAVDEFGETYTIPYGEIVDGSPTGIFELAPFGTDYIYFEDLRGNHLLHIDGDDTLEYGWSWDEENQGWYSGTGDLFDAILVSEPYMVDSEDVLTINTFYDFEEDWDFGFVQVSTDSGNNWISLENEYTTSLHDPQAHPLIIENLPGLTGTSGDFITLNFDLSSYAGEEVLIRFRYLTDWYTHNYGWFISSANIDGYELELSDVDDLNANFMVTIVEKYENPGGVINFNIHQMSLDDLDEYGSEFIHTQKWEDIIALVSLKNIKSSGDYKFAVTRMNPKHIE
ncbi:MAG: Immune inhibitor A peptidase M6 [Promethearchaeota archaeon]|nr:MAG: Immune inhibitor A peptidase M6 [Candidatus Lokiarchaeota archaeon]